MAIAGRGANARNASATQVPVRTRGPSDETVTLGMPVTPTT
jgi:hypothetical protein